MRYSQLNPILDELVKEGRFMKATRITQIALLAVSIIFFMGISISSSAVNRGQLSTDCFMSYGAANNWYDKGDYQQAIKIFTE